MASAVTMNDTVAGHEDGGAGYTPHSHEIDEHKFVWLERRLGQASTIDRHTYCHACGAVRQLEHHGRPVSFFVQGVANLVEEVERRRLGRITQAEARLMMKAVSHCDALNDSYSTTVDMQVDIFSAIILTFRPSLHEDLLTRSLFRRRAGKKE